VYAPATGSADHASAELDDHFDVIGFSLQRIPEASGLLMARRRLW
jgi:hypothetical protein